jgi:hypothetical protein
MDVQREDEVIVPAMTFVASADVVELAGAKVAFADVEPDSLLLTPEIVAKHVTEAHEPSCRSISMASIATSRASGARSTIIREDPARFASSKTLGIASRASIAATSRRASAMWRGGTTSHLPLTRLLTLR